MFSGALGVAQCCGFDSQVGTVSGHVPLHLKEATSKDEGRFVIKIGRTEGNGVDIRVIKHGFAIPREVGQDLSEFF